MADRVERAKVYFEALEPYDTRDIDAAVRSLLSGTEPGVNPAFAPAAPIVAAAARRAMNLRLDSEYRDRLSRPQLPPPDIEKTAESRARVAATAKAVASLAANMRTDEAAAAKRKADFDERTHVRFDPSQEPAQLKYRLHIGDPEADGDLGQMEKRA